MDLQLVGKRALVTGGSAGIGEAIAKVLAAEGAAVAVHGRHEERTRSVVAEIEATGGKAVAILGDLTVEEQATGIAERARNELGGIDILVNNAGGTGEKLRWEATPITAWKDTFDRNVLAAVRLIDQLLPAMRQAGWGRIINISSVASVMPQATGPEYSASKAAMNNLGLSLAKSLGASGVTVNSICPGMIHTPKLEQVFRQMANDAGWAGEDATWEELERTFLKVSQVPLGRIGRPEEVAHAVAFLCSPLAAYITGSTMRIDGGVVPTL
jgi:3-oxoacyl-[acyl-carrier protein] reductase